MFKKIMLGFALSVSLPALVSSAKMLTAEESRNEDGQFRKGVYAPITDGLGDAYQRGSSNRSFFLGAEFEKYMSDGKNIGFVAKPIKRRKKKNAPDNIGIERPSTPTSPSGSSDSASSSSDGEQ